MNDEQKNKATEAHGKLQSWLVGLGVPANWAKVGAGIIIGGAIGALATCQQSCESVTPQQVSAAHALYHAVTGEPCTLAQPAPVVAFKK